MALSYEASGSLIADTRTDDVITSRFEYGMNARRRLSTVSENGALKASYVYDMSEQRIIKTLAGEAPIHYHYDDEGRLISETDAATGETIRDYVWLGLTPIASFGANDNAPPPAAEPCSEDEIAALAEQAAQIETQRAELQAFEAQLETVKAIYEQQIVLVEAALETATGFRGFVLRFIARVLERTVVAIDNAVVNAQAQNAQLGAQAEAISSQITALEAACEAAEEEVSPAAGVTFLHSDHLGRPQFGTNGAGEIVWDGASQRRSG